MILALLSLITFPSVLKYTQSAQEAVCKSNREMIQSDYALYLLINKLTHSDMIFENYMTSMSQKICPEGGVFTYDGHEVICSKHTTIEQETETPYLYID